MRPSFPTERAPRSRFLKGAEFPSLFTLERHPDRFSAAADFSA